MTIPLWVWLIAGLGLSAMIVVWAALALASICDDQEEQLREQRKAYEAIRRASNIRPMR